MRASITRAVCSAVAAGALISLGLACPAGAASTSPYPRPADPVTAYVVNYGFGTVTPISTATNKPGKAIKVGDEPFAIAITPGREDRLRQRRPGR